MSDQIVISFAEQCIVLKNKGFTQKQACKQFQIHKTTLINRLKEQGLKWSDLPESVSSLTSAPVAPPISKLAKTASHPTSPSFIPSSAKPTVTTSPPIPSQVLANLSVEAQALLQLPPNTPTEILKLIITELNAKRTIPTKPAWFRPTCMYPKQEAIINAINDPKIKILAVEGPRRVGKSTAVYIGINEAIYTEYIRFWALYGAKEQSAAKILQDVWKDPLTLVETKPLHIAKTYKKLEYFNQGSIEVQATTVSSSKGLQFGGIWLTEFDQILKDNPEVFASIVGIIRSEPNLKIILDMNLGTGAMTVLKDRLMKIDYKDTVTFITLNNEDVTHLNVQTDGIVADLMDCAMGKEYVDAQLNNIETHSGDVFRPKDIVEAMQSYPDFMKAVEDIPMLTCIGVDPGYCHPTGVFVAGLYRGHVFEIDAHELAGKDTSEERIKAIVAECAKEYHGVIRCESNSGGMYWVKDWREKYQLQAENQNFSSNKLGIDSRESMVRILRELMEQHRFHFESTKLREELLRYNPDKDKNDSKGDLADACLHAVYYLLNQYKTEGKQVAW